METNTNTNLHKRIRLANYQEDIDKMEKMEN